MENLRHGVAIAIEDGASLADVERRLNALHLSEAQFMHLWLYAWGLLRRREREPVFAYPQEFDDGG